MYMMLSINQQIFCQMGSVSPDGYFIYNLREFIFEYHNAVFFRIFGLEPAALNGSMDWLMAKFHTDDVGNELL